MAVGQYAQRRRVRAVPSRLSPSQAAIVANLPSFNTAPTWSSSVVGEALEVPGLASWELDDGPELAPSPAHPGLCSLLAHWASEQLNSPGQSYLFLY